MNKFRTAIIGCGAVAKNHGKALLSSQYAELRYCVDIDRTKAEEFAKTYGGKVLTSYKDLFSKDDVDVVHIVTPHFTHPEIAIDCMEHGLDVFCEKPLAIHVSDGERMIQTADRTGRRLNVCFQNRLNDSSVRAKQLLDSGVYGKIISAAAIVRWDRHGEYYSKSPWRGQYNTEGGGTIINQSIHTLDLLQYLTGGISAVAAVDAKLRSTDDYEVEDSCMANFRLKSGGSAVGYFTNCAAGFKTAEIEIVCEKARLVIAQKGLEITTAGGVERFESEVATGEKSEWGLSHGRMIDAFYAALRDGIQVPVDGRAALEAVKIIEALQHSKGKEIIVK